MTELNFYFTTWIKFFFLFTPFFALSMFLSMTRRHADPQRKRLAVQITAAVGIICLALYFFGNAIFTVFGITVDAFRVGAGALLFLSAIGLAQSKEVSDQGRDQEDIAVVPLAMPIIVGPATTGTLLVFGAEISPDEKLKWIGCFALLCAVIGVGVILYLGTFIEKALGSKGLNILSKITGLVLAAMAAQMILTGAHNIFTK